MPPRPAAVRRAALALAATLVCLLALASPSLAADTTPGDVHFVRPAQSSFDAFTADSTWAPFMNQHYWRMRAYSSYFDSRTSWYPNAWAYFDSYAIYNPSDLATQHPDWVFRDMAGNKLFIPYGCSGGTCPQYAADITNAAYRQWWLDKAASMLSHGYKGLFIDDVNMWVNTGDGNGTKVAPKDPSTGQPMTDAAWKKAMADFMVQIRTRFPSIEIVHNSVWFVGTADADVRRQIGAANTIEVERGVNDGGLTGGTGQWSLRALFSYMDAVHQIGPGVVLDSWVTNDADREYGLASYFLISSGRDGIGNDQGGTPTDWWRGYDTKLGAPLGGRYDWNGLIRRDFTGGSVLVNEPGAPARTVDLGAAYTRIDGSASRTVTVNASRGAVLLNPTLTTVTPPPDTSTTTTTTPPPPPVAPQQPQPVTPAPVVVPPPPPVQPTATTTVPKPVSKPAPKPAPPRRRPPAGASRPARRAHATTRRRRAPPASTAAEAARPASTIAACRASASSSRPRPAGTSPSTPCGPPCASRASRSR